MSRTQETLCPYWDHISIGANVRWCVWLLSWNQTFGVWSFGDCRHALEILNNLSSVLRVESQALWGEQWHGYNFKLTRNLIQHTHIHTRHCSQHSWHRGLSPQQTVGNAHGCRPITSLCDSPRDDRWSSVVTFWFSYVWSPLTALPLLCLLWLLAKKLITQPHIRHPDSPLFYSCSLLVYYWNF